MWVMSVTMIVVAVVVGCLPLLLNYSDELWGVVRNKFELWVSKRRGAMLESKEAEEGVGILRVYTVRP